MVIRWAVAQASFRTPNWANALPGDAYEGDEPDGFYSRDELVEYFEGYAAKFELQVVEGLSVAGVDADGDGFRVTDDVAGRSKPLWLRTLSLHPG